MEIREGQDLFHKSGVSGNLIKDLQGSVPFLGGWKIKWKIKTFSIPLTEHTRFIEGNVREEGLREIMCSELLWCYALITTQALAIPGAIKLAVNHLAQKI